MPSARPRSTVRALVLRLLLAALGLPAVRARGELPSPPAPPYRPAADPVFVSSEQPAVARTWHPTNRLKELGIKSGPAFDAGLVKVFCEDTKWSSEMAVFRFPDGTVREWKTKSFSAEDLAAMQALKAKAPVVNDPRTWVTKLDERTQKMVDAKAVTKFETRHFVFVYGNAPTDDVRKNFTAPQFIERAGQWYEKVWTAYESDFQVAMPWAGNPQPQRIVVKLYNTGIPFVGNGWANSAREMALNPNAMEYGSTVIGHEFGHVVQAYTGGFMVRPSVGPWWETHAQIGSVNVVPTHDDSLGAMFANLSRGCQWPDSRYSNWAILMHLWEKRRTNRLVYDVWTKNQRDPKGTSLEDPLETTVRLGQADRSLPGGWESFGEEIGEMGARMVTCDYVNQGYLADVSAGMRKKTMSAIAPDPATPGWFAAPAEKKFYAYGVEWLPLTPEPGAAQIVVGFRGQSQDPGAKWRLTLVAVGKDNAARYSPRVTAAGAMEAKVALAVQPNEQYVLAVAATPATYRPLTWKQTPDFDYPYLVSAAGAKFNTAPPPPPAPAPTIQ